MTVIIVELMIFSTFLLSVLTLEQIILEVAGQQKLKAVQQLHNLQSEKQEDLRLKSLCLKTNQEAVLEVQIRRRNDFTYSGILC